MTALNRGICGAIKLDDWPTGVGVRDILVSFVMNMELVVSLPLTYPTVRSHNSGPGWNF